MAQTLHYSGNRSRAFWNRIKALPEGENHTTIYMMGVTLQDLELRILQTLESAEAEATSRWDITTASNI